MVHSVRTALHTLQGRPVGGSEATRETKLMGAR